MKTICLVVMGVAGSGKSTVGRAVAEQLGWTFVDADDHHPAANIDKMRRGIPLEDEDRSSWLAALAVLIDGALMAETSLVVACSALKRRYRDRLGVDGERVRLVYLAVDEAELRRRLLNRVGHFMGATLLGSQLADLEAPSPTEALVLDGTEPLDVLVRQIRESLPSDTDCL